jgi:hypothetical protein
MSRRWRRVLGRERGGGAGKNAVSAARWPAGAGLASPAFSELARQRLEDLGVLVSALVCSNQDNEPSNHGDVTAYHRVFVILCRQRSQQC